MGDGELILGLDGLAGGGVVQNAVHVVVADAAVLLLGHVPEHAYLAAAELLRGHGEVVQDHLLEALVLRTGAGEAGGGDDHVGDTFKLCQDILQLILRQIRDNRVLTALHESSTGNGAPEVAGAVVLMLRQIILGRVRGRAVLILDLPIDPQEERGVIGLLPHGPAAREHHIALHSAGDAVVGDPGLIVAGGPAGEDIDGVADGNGRTFRIGGIHRIGISVGHGIISREGHAGRRRIVPFIGDAQLRLVGHEAEGPGLVFRGKLGVVELHGAAIVLGRLDRTGEVIRTVIERQAGGGILDGLDLLGLVVAGVGEIRHRVGAVGGAHKEHHRLASVHLDGCAGRHLLKVLAAHGVVDLHVPGTGVPEGIVTGLAVVPAQVDGGLFAGIYGTGSLLIAVSSNGHGIIRPFARQVEMGLASAVGSCGVGFTGKPVVHSDLGILNDGMGEAGVPNGHGGVIVIAVGDRSRGRIALAVIFRGFELDGFADFRLGCIQAEGGLAVSAVRMSHIGALLQDGENSLAVFIGGLLIHRLLAPGVVPGVPVVQRDGDALQGLAGLIHHGDGGGAAAVGLALIGQYAAGQQAQHQHQRHQSGQRASFQSCHFRSPFQIGRSKSMAAGLAWRSVPR